MSCATIEILWGGRLLSLNEVVHGPTGAANRKAGAVPPCRSLSHLCPWIYCVARKISPGITGKIDMSIRVSRPFPRSVRSKPLISPYDMVRGPPGPTRNPFDAKFRLHLDKPLIPLPRQNPRFQIPSSNDGYEFKHIPWRIANHRASSALSDLCCPSSPFHSVAKRRLHLSSVWPYARVKICSQFLLRVSRSHGSAQQVTKPIIPSS
ncbi:uncharacterized protein BT62DRAFT_148288 [Guyanagaster necrorhizus]|uniref:Uncharacterized protein n=1 Tax=Guyanagaster necrorhizus TaxID=856835 RepID=A0A9P8AS78_9AGAR|nr:uncharacterized protein BT62DRAFT_148288 [Guyanagaster necrorhizus MCA 3950]KAG7446014.1 hypothetical protein BT62DRAFT_148288 [Guyanagaster necrorhizus MCA 3950]